jgi:hypothetical protein
MGKYTGSGSAASVELNSGGDTVFKSIKDGGAFRYLLEMECILFCMCLLDPFL